MKKRLIFQSVEHGDIEIDIEQADNIIHIDLDDFLGLMKFVNIEEHGEVLIQEIVLEGD